MAEAGRAEIGIDGGITSEFLVLKFTLSGVEGARTKGRIVRNAEVSGGMTRRALAKAQGSPD
jgi:hypothetical protein